MAGRGLVRVGMVGTKTGGVGVICGAGDEVDAGVCGAAGAAGGPEQAARASTRTRIRDEMNLVVRVVRLPTNC